jgi:RimJ/RimL family protein N-acetyltransferase
MVTLWTLAGNHSAQRFYEALGFCFDGTTKVETMPGFQLDQVRYSIRIHQGEAGRDDGG